MRHMSTFHSAREAKEFLVSRIVAESQREALPLSEIERKMLYFTESGWTLPDIMEVSDEFDREYDQDEYEKKIAKLIRNALSRNQKESKAAYDEWQAAIRILRKEDHYLLVMIDMAHLRPPGDQFKLFLTAMAIVTAILVAEFLSVKYRITFPEYFRYLRRDFIFLYMWVGLVVAVVVYYVAVVFLGRQKANDATAKLIGKAAKFFRKSSTRSS
jgi:hypothetical protein